MLFARRMKNPPREEVRGVLKTTCSLGGKRCSSSKPAMRRRPIPLEAVILPIDEKVQRAYLHVSYATSSRRID